MNSSYLTLGLIRLKNFDYTKQQIHLLVFFKGKTIPREIAHYSVENVVLVLKRYLNVSALVALFLK